MHFLSLTAVSINDQQPWLLPYDIHHNRWAGAALPMGSPSQLPITERLLKCAWSWDAQDFGWRIPQPPCQVLTEMHSNLWHFHPTLLPSLSPSPGVRSALSLTSPSFPQLPLQVPLKAFPLVPCTSNPLLLKGPRWTVLVPYKKFQQEYHFQIV